MRVDGYRRELVVRSGDVARADELDARSTMRPMPNATARDAASDSVTTSIPTDSKTVSVTRVTPDASSRNPTASASLGRTQGIP